MCSKFGPSIYQELIYKPSPEFKVTQNPLILITEYSNREL